MPATFFKKAKYTRFCRRASLYPTCVLYYSLQKHILVWIVRDIVQSTWRVPASGKVTKNCSAIGIIDPTQKEHTSVVKLETGSLQIHIASICDIAAHFDPVYTLETSPNLEPASPSWNLGAKKGFRWNRKVYAIMSLCYSLYRATSVSLPVTAFCFKWQILW